MIIEEMLGSMKCQVACSSKAPWTTNFIELPSLKSYSHPAKIYNNLRVENIQATSVLDRMVNSNVSTAPKVFVWQIYKPVYTWPTEIRAFPSDKIFMPFWKSTRCLLASDLLHNACAIQISEHFRLSFGRVIALNWELSVSLSDLCDGLWGRKPPKRYFIVCVWHAKNIRRWCCLNWTNFYCYLT